MKQNLNSSERERVDAKIVEEVKGFLYLGSRATEDEGKEEVINNRLTTTSLLSQSYTIV